jgi:lipopolysaccharide/colanic/teichoic acid biosynthesis glycosyltransferase
MGRVFDVLISLLLLVFFSPLFLIVGMVIKLNSKGPVFFTQMRIGKDNKLFKFYKFRTMKVGTPWMHGKNCNRFSIVPKSACLKIQDTRSFFSFFSKFSIR